MANGRKLGRRKAASSVVGLNVLFHVVQRLFLRNVFVSQRVINLNTSNR